jgi:hypothetical protein
VLQFRQLETPGRPVKQPCAIAADFVASKYYIAASRSPLSHHPNNFLFSCCVNRASIRCARSTLTLFDRPESGPVLLLPSLAFLYCRDTATLPRYEGGDEYIVVAPIPHTVLQHQRLSPFRTYHTDRRPLQGHEHVTMSYNRLGKYRL